MSYKNLKLTLWTKNEVVRVYIGTRFCDHRNGMSYADGSWIYRDEDGSTRFGYKPMYHGAEDRALSLEEVSRMLCGSTKLTLTWDELLARMEACQTKGGNFSYVKYEKAYGDSL